MLTDTIKQSLKLLPLFKKVVVGVSGGADSVALARMLMKLGYEVVIAHLNHGLRGKESDADEKFVVNLSKKWGAECVTKRIGLPKKGNVENNARLARYLFLEKVRQEKGADFVAVAHHQDDQVETILMHMMRGAGLRGLCGMKIQTNKVIRPLLTVPKQQLIDYLKKEKIECRIDETNFDTKFQRNLYRHEVIPKCRKKDKDFEEKLLKLSENAQKQMAVIEKCAREWIQKQVTKEAFDRFAFLGLTDGVQSEVLFLLAGYQDVYRPSIQKIKALIQKGVTGKQKKLGSLTFQNEYGRVIFFQGMKKEKLPRVKLTTHEIRWGKWTLKLNQSDDLYVRSWKPGDRFHPTGMKGTKKLQDFFVDQKIPKNDRHQLPIIVNSQDQIVTVANRRLDKRFLELNVKQNLLIKS